MGTRPIAAALLALAACRKPPPADPPPAAPAREAPADLEPAAGFNDDALEKSLAKLEAMKKAAARAAQPQAAQAQNERPLVEETPRVPLRGAVTSDWFEDSDGHRRAQAEQERSRAPMFVYVFTDWCPHCKRFDGALQSRPIDDWLRNVVKVKVNPEHSREDHELSRALGVTGYPTMLVVPGPGLPAVKVRGLARQGSVDEAKAYELFVRGCRDAMTHASQRVVVEAHAKHQSKDLQGARAAYEQALLLDPENADAWYRMALVDVELQQPGQALGALKRSLELDPKLAGSETVIGTLYAAAKQNDEAKRHFERGCSLGDARACSQASRVPPPSP